MALRGAKIIAVRLTLAARLFTAVILIAEPARAQVVTGQRMLIPCLQSAEGTHVERTEFCLGVIYAVASLEMGNHWLGSCLPSNSSQGSVTARVVKWLQTHPDRLSQPFVVLVALAIQELYPC